MPRAWGYWTQAKLLVLREYLAGFTVASSSVSERVYLDAFAGEGSGIARVTGEEFEGSPRIALQTEPPFTKLRFFERPRRAAQLKADLVKAFPGRDLDVAGGDCNDRIPQVLETLPRWAPTFAFLDPFGMSVRWETLETLAAHKRAKTKVELWMLLPSGGIPRSLRLKGDLPESAQDRADGMFGCEDWRWIYVARRAKHLTGLQARELYVNLMRWRLEQVLHYKWTHPLEFRNGSTPIYHMVFATDHDVGTSIMTSLYKKAAIETYNLRTEEEETVHGGGRLFELEELGPPKLKRYEYSPPEDPEQALQAFWT